MSLWSASSVGLARACQTTHHSTPPLSPQPLMACPTRSPSSINPHTSTGDHQTKTWQHIRAHTLLFPTDLLICSLTTNTQSIYWLFRCPWQSSDRLDYFDQRSVQTSGHIDTSFDWHEDALWPPIPFFTLCVAYNKSNINFSAFLLLLWWVNDSVERQRQSCVHLRISRGLWFALVDMQSWRRRMMVELDVGYQTATAAVTSFET